MQRNSVSRHTTRLLVLAALLATYDTTTALAQRRPGGFHKLDRHTPMTHRRVTRVNHPNSSLTRTSPSPTTDSAIPVARKRQPRNRCEAIAQQHWDEIEDWVRRYGPWNIPEKIDHMIEDVLECMFTPAGATGPGGRYINFFAPGVLGLVPQVVTPEALSPVTSPWAGPIGTMFGR